MQGSHSAGDAPSSIHQHTVKVEMFLNGVDVFIEVSIVLLVLWKDKGYRRVGNVELVMQFVKGFLSTCHES